jgi:hypothetical protein
MQRMVALACDGAILPTVWVAVGLQAFNQISLWPLNHMRKKL